MSGTLHSEANSELRKILVEARNERGLSQAALAKMIGRPPSFVGKYELAERRLDFVELLVVLRALNLEFTSVVEQMQHVLPSKLGQDKS